MKMPWWGKAISGFVGIVFAVITGMWAFFEAQDLRMDYKVSKSEERTEKKISDQKVELIGTMDFRRALRDVEVKGMEDRLTSKIQVAVEKVDELKKDVRGLYEIGKTIDRKVTIVHEPRDLYTKNKSKDSNVGGSL
jgi:hypothetical protein